MTTHRQQSLRFQAWYLGETWAVFDMENDRYEPIKNRDYASARSAQRAADRMNEVTREPAQETLL